MSAEIAALDAWVDGDEMVRVAERAAREGTPDDQRDAVNRLRAIIGEMEGQPYVERLRAQAREALRARGTEPTSGYVEQTVRHNKKLHYIDVTRALAALAGVKVEAVGQLLLLSEQRLDEEVRLAALAALQGHVSHGLLTRLLAIASDRRSPVPVRAAALERVSEIGEADALQHLWPLVEGDGPPLLRQRAAEAALTSGGADAAAELFRRLPADADYPPEMVDALATRLKAMDPPVTDTVVAQLEAESWPCRVIALRVIAGTPDAAQRARPLQRDRADLLPPEAWAAAGELHTVGDLARTVAEGGAGP